MQKSHIAGFLLTFLFGPLGLFYSSVGSALFFIIIGLFVVPLTGGAALIVFWVASVLWGFVCVSSYNSKVMKQEAKVIKMAQSFSSTSDGVMTTQDDTNKISRSAFIAAALVMVMVLVFFVATKESQIAPIFTAESTPEELAEIKLLADSIPKKP